MRLFLPLMFMASLLSATVRAAEPIDLIGVYQLAVEHNADLAAAHAVYRARSEQQTQARAALLPQLGASASNSSIRTQVDTRELGQLSSKRHSYSYQANLSQPLFRLDRWYQLKAAQADNEQAILELSATEQAIILQSAQVYLAVLRAQDHLAASLAEEEAFQQQLELTTVRFDVGLADKTDALQAQAAHDNARANRIQAAQLLDDAQQALVTLTNQPLQRLQGLRHSLPVLAPAPSQASDWVERAQRDNLELQAIAQAVTAAEHDLRSRKSEHAPTLNAIAQYQRGDNDSLGFANSGMPGMPTYNRHAEQKILGLQLNIPLYSGGATSSRVRQGHYQLEHAQHSQESARRNLVQNTRNLHRAVTTDVEQVQARKQSVVSNQSAVEATQIGYEVGTRSIVDVLDTQRQLYAAVRNYNDARYNYILNTLRLQQLVGRLSPEHLLALNEYLDPDYQPARDFVPSPAAR